jgi:hypothetical protein
MKEAAAASKAAKLKSVLGKSEEYADKVMEKHHKEAYHLKPAEVAKIADKEVSKETKPRADRKARKKGGRTKGDVTIIIAQKPDVPAAPAMAAPPMPPRPMPPVAPPPAAAMPPQGMPNGMPMGGAMPPPGMQRKKGGRLPDMDAGGGGAMGRLEKLAAYGSKA